MPTPRRTIARPAEVTGLGLHEGRTTHVRLLPAETGGITFRRVDIAESGAIPALASARQERPRRTALVDGKVEVHTVEHLLAAIQGLGITDLAVEIDQIEVPGLDGSALEFLRALETAGLRDLPGEARVLVLDRVLVVEEPKEKGGARIVAVPCPGRLVLEYLLDYAADLPTSRFSFEVTRDGFTKDVAPARTFCLAREAEMLRVAGLGKGATFQNTLVIGADGLPVENTLRFKDEYARHKALDLLGDLALCGARIEARIFAYKSGHALNAAMARKLAEVLAEKPVAPASPAASPADPHLVPEGGGRFVAPEIAFAGHFPDFATLPGVVSLAAMADAAGGRLRSIEGARFRRLSRPGETLSVTATRDGARARGTIRLSDATDRGPIVAEADLVLEAAPDARSPSISLEAR